MSNEMDQNHLYSLDAEMPMFTNKMNVDIDGAIAIFNKEERHYKLQQLAKEYNNENWLTSNLIQEIESNFPTSEDIDQDESKFNCRDRIKFKENIEKMLPIGRLFASKIQLKQYLKPFCEKWAIKIVVNGKAIQCFYRDPKRKKKSIADTSKHRNMSSSVSTQCPFKVGFNIIQLVKSMSKRNWKPDIFYKLKITSLNADHTCSLDTTSLRVAITKAGDSHTISCPNTRVSKKTKLASPHVELKNTQQTFCEKNSRDTDNRNDINSIGFCQENSSPDHKKEMADERKLIIDSDAGVDDAIAILIALNKKNVNVLALVSVFGNTESDQAAENLRRFVGIHKHAVASSENGTGNTLNGGTKVYKGSVTPMIELKVPESWIGHGPNGLGGAPCEECIKPYLPSIEKEHGVNAMIKIAKEHPKQVDVIALGPLTNLAMAYKLDPTFFKNIRSLYIMGGSVTAKGFHADPEAAKIVLSAAPLDIAEDKVVVIPWEPCEKASTTWSHFDKLTSYPTLKSRFFKSISFSQEYHLRPSEGNSMSEHRSEDLILPDVAAMIAMLYPKELIISDSAKLYVKVVTGGTDCRGMCIIDWYGRHHKGAPRITLIREMVSSYIWDVVVHDLVKGV